MAAEAPAASPDDRALMRAHVAGDAEAFGTLFARHRERLWAVALRTTGDPEVAADGLQDGMVAAFRRAASYRGEAQVTTWLHRVVVNACLDRLRAASVRRAVPLADDEEPPPGRLLAAASGPEDPAERAVALDRRGRVLDALATLPAEQRAALVLVDMEAYPVAEAAEVLGCAVGTVKSRCHRGRQRLAALLADLVTADADDPDDPDDPDEHAGAAPERNRPGGRDVPSTRAARAPPASGAGTPTDRTTETPS